MRIKGSILVLLVGLLFIKVSAFHVYSHEDADNQIETCGYCDLAVENQQAELTPAFTSSEVIAPPTEYVATRFDLAPSATSSIYSSYFFARPPPAWA